METIFKLFMIIALLFTVSACSNTPVEEEKEEVKEEIFETYTRGVWADGVYTNDFIGISFTLPETWTVATDDELLSLIDTSSAQLSEEDKKNLDKAMESAIVFYDLMVYDLTTGENIMLAIEDLEKQAGAILITEDAYLDKTEEQLSNTENFTYTLVGRTDETLAGKKYRVLEITSQEILTQKMYVRKEGKYLVTLIVSYSTIGSAGTEQILAEIQ